MPWKRNLYPENWEAMSHACKERAGWKCEHCGVAEGEMRLSQTGNPYTVHLVAAHVNHDPENPDAVLIALCNACHFKYDQQMHISHGLRTKKAKKHKTQVDAGQLKMWEMSHEGHVRYTILYKNCGRASCGKCRDGTKAHGPYKYATWRDETGCLHTKCLGKAF